MGNFRENAHYLRESGADFHINPMSGLLVANRLDVVEAIWLAHNLTNTIDELYGRSDDQESWETALESVKRNLADETGRRIYGETRPANSNTAVRVDDRRSWDQGTMRQADNRNTFEDHHDPSDRTLIHRSFIVVLDKIILPHEDSALRELLE